MEETQYPHVEKTRKKIMRRSIYTFFQHYQFFTTTAVVLLFPFSASSLLLQAVSASSSPRLLAINSCFSSCSRGLGFSLPSQLVRHLSETVFTSILSLPFALTFLILAKAFILQALIHHQKPTLHSPFFSLVTLYKRLFLTQLCNSEFLLILDIVSFSIISIALHTLDTIGFPSNNQVILLVAKTVLYSILANADIICNSALVMAASETNTIKGYLAIFKACLLSWNRNSKLLSLNFPINLSILGLESLFQYRIVRVFGFSGTVTPSLAFEGLLIAYLHSLVIVLDTIASCIFIKSCKTSYQTGGDHYCNIKLVKNEDAQLL